MTDPQWVPPGSGTPTGATPTGAAPTEAPPVGGPPYAAMPLAHPAMEFRPGVIPLRPLRLGDIYGAVVKAIRGNVAATMGLALITTLIFLVPTTALGAWIGSMETLDVNSSDTAFPVTGTIGQSVPAIGTSLSAVLLTGFLAFVIGQAVMGRRVTAAQTWEGTRGRLPQVFGATILTGLAVTVVLAAVLAVPVVVLVGAVRNGGQGSIVGAVVLVVVAAVVALLAAWYLSTRLAFVTAAVVLERLGIAGGIRRSWALTGGREFWRVLGIRLLTSVIVGVAAQIIAVPLGVVGVVALVATDDPSKIYVWQAVIAGLSGLVSGALTTPFTAGVDSLLYVDQRIRREGFDVQLITAAQVDAARSWPGAARQS